MNKKYSAMALLLMGGLMLPLGMEAGVRVDGPENSVTKTNEMITGMVTSAQGERLIGVVVRNADNGDNCTTDADGRFAISGHPGETLEFSYIGYKQQHQQADKSMRIVMIDDNQMLNEVIVTTQKKRQSAIEVPAAVSAVTGEGLGKLNLYQMDDMAMMVPGLQIQIQSPNNPGYVIRGVTDDDGASYSQPRVSVFLDGVSTSRSRASVTELYDLERVEVAKGPQGTLFGRGAEIGGISIIRTALWVIGLFTLLSGIVGVSNIMLITVKERTREFGVRKAIGAKPWQILKLIITESVITTAIFGYIGMLCGIAANEYMDATIGHNVIDTGLFQATMFVDPTVGLDVCIQATMVIIVAGTIAGLIPALKAARVRPIEALRAE